MCARAAVGQLPSPQPTEANQASFVARLQLVVRQWPSIDRLAKAACVSPSAFRKWLKGEAEPSRSRLIALAGAAGVSISWLAQGEGAAPDLLSLAARAHANQSPELARHLDADQFVFLPENVQGAAAGSGHHVPDLPAEVIGFRHSWLRATFNREPSDLLLEVVVGDSMEPGICNNDRMLVDVTDRKFSNFGIYVIEVRGERLVKRVQRKVDGSLILISDNKAYEPEAISPELAKEVHVVGRVVWRGGLV